MMNLQPITRSTTINKVLASRGLEFKTIGRCIARDLSRQRSLFLRCNGNVREGVDFADLDGAPFLAYYCAPCAAELQGATS